MIAAYRAGGPFVGLSTCILSFNIFSREKDLWFSSDTHLYREAKNLTRKGTKKEDNLILHRIFLDSPDIFFFLSPCVCLSLFFFFLYKDQHLQEIKILFWHFLFFFFLDICALTLLKRSFQNQDDSFLSFNFSVLKDSQPFLFEALFTDFH